MEAVVCSMPRPGQKTQLISDQSFLPTFQLGLLEAAAGKGGPALEQEEIRRGPTKSPDCRDTLCTPVKRFGFAKMSHLQI
jgi:hypothetical protein